MLFCCSKAHRCTKDCFEYTCSLLKWGTRPLFLLKTNSLGLHYGMRLLTLHTLNPPLHWGELLVLDIYNEIIMAGDVTDSISPVTNKFSMIRPHYIHFICSLCPMLKHEPNFTYKTCTYFMSSGNQNDIEISFTGETGVQNKKGISSGIHLNGRWTERI